MADTRSTEIKVPTKEVRITGERTATLVGLAIQASRIDTSILAMKMAGPDTRRRANEASERWERAVAQFEAEMREVRIDLDLTRTAPRQAIRAAQKADAKEKVQQVAPAKSKPGKQKRKKKASPQAQGQIGAAKQPQPAAAAAQSKSQQKPAPAADKKPTPAAEPAAAEA
ncbi:MULTISPECIES: hypothetical protein [Pseudomonas]|uniref:Uncharacterized protein n=1 Tax=Pseudomonas nitroreducens TaxID=46680 RepID=A0A6G6JAR1_PSENT|nr:MULTISPECIES: hypothetical protein [Pseudomonas]MDU4254082.1 hypothetical protein [Pseudomonas sp.]QIE91561.1 hypothetical protein G5B91_35100 [Pseudomonas nitroreducens]